MCVIGVPDWLCVRHFQGLRRGLNSPIGVRQDCRQYMQGTNCWVALLFCKGDKTTDPFEWKDEWGHVLGDFGQTPPSIIEGINNEALLDLAACQWSQSHCPGTGYVKSISKFWSGLASFLNKESLEGSWKSVLPSDRPKTLQLLRRYAWKNGPK